MSAVRDHRALEKFELTDVDYFISSPELLYELQESILDMGQTPTKLNKIIIRQSSKSASQEDSSVDLNLLKESLLNDLQEKLPHIIHL